MARIKQTGNSFEADPETMVPRFARSRPGPDCLLVEPEEGDLVPAPSPARPPPQRQSPIGSEIDLVAKQRLERTIAVYLPTGRLALTVTDNRYTMISVKRDKGLYRLRVHHMFLDAGPEVVRAIGRYIGENEREASAMLSSYIDANQNKIRRSRRTRNQSLVLQTSGDLHDLAEIYSELNQRYFNNGIVARITWGQRAQPGARRRRRNSIKMGSYSVEERLIRIHPSLDRPFVPRYFVAWIVYHEMLHQKHDIPIVDGRRQFHTPAFMAEERLFDEFERAQQWERVHLNRLLVY